MPGASRFRKKTYALVVIAVTLFVAGCSEGSGQTVQRWYTQQQADDGARIFKRDCASCHGKNAQSTPDWKKADKRGNYPAPPLDGSAHSWHHDLSALRSTIEIGGVPLGGTMPAFKGKLNSKQRDSVIAHFQDFWPNDIYGKWASRFPDE
jgi:mono/diheme cytochrome c family protein